jgi:hypothetical protein
MKLNYIDCFENNRKKCLTKYIIISFSALTLTMVSGLAPVEAKTGEVHQHGAHIHGIADLNIAIEGSELYVEFLSPAANIVGFEHSPRTEEQKAAVQQAIDTLKNWEKLFVLPSLADCKLSDLDVDTNIEGDADHSSGSGDEHKHSAETGEYDEESHHDGDANEHAEEGARHSEFKAAYLFVCGKPDKLTHADVMLSSVFPGIEHIETQLLTQTKKTALELTIKSNRIDF